MHYRVPRCRSQRPSGSSPGFSCIFHASCCRLVLNLELSWEDGGRQGESGLEERAHWRQPDPSGLPAEALGVSAGGHHGKGPETSSGGGRRRCQLQCIQQGTAGGLQPRVQHQRAPGQPLLLRAGGLGRARGEPWRRGADGVHGPDLRPREPGHLHAQDQPPQEGLPVCQLGPGATGAAKPNWDAGEGGVGSAGAMHQQLLPGECGHRWVLELTVGLWRGGRALSRQGAGIWVITPVPEKSGTSSHRGEKKKVPSSVALC